MKKGRKEFVVKFQICHRGDLRERVMICKYCYIFQKRGENKTQNLI